MGCIALGERSFFDALTQLQLTAASTELPFAASVLCHSAPTHTAAQVQGWFEALAPLCYRLGVARPVVVSIHFGGSLPATIARLHVSGIVFAVTVTNCAEGAVCRTAEIDSHVAQGSEAGGHRGASTPRSTDAADRTPALVEQLVRQYDTTVVAAGAAAVLLGTAFLRCTEAGTRPAHRAALLGNAPTVVTAAFF